MLLYLFSEFPLLDTKKILFDGFYLISLMMYYLLLPAQVLILIFDVFI